jgi:hypothetical protein
MLNPHFKNTLFLAQPAPSEKLLVQERAQTSFCPITLQV